MKKTLRNGGGGGVTVLYIKHWTVQSNKFLNNKCKYAHPNSTLIVDNVRYVTEKRAETQINLTG
jgi:hypothetical protein